MKLSSKLPKRNGLSESELTDDLVERPRTRRLLVVEVVVAKIERVYDEEEGYSFDVPTARIVSGEYLTDPRDISAAQVLAMKAKARRTGADPLPGLGVGDSLTISSGGKSVTIPGGRIDPTTGEVFEVDHA